MNRYKVILFAVLIAAGVAGCSENNTMTPEEKTKFSKGVQEGDGGATPQPGTPPKDSTAEAKD